MSVNEMLLSRKYDMLLNHKEKNFIFFEAAENMRVPPHYEMKYRRYLISFPPYLT